jgi:hypothetical protein
MIPVYDRRDFQDIPKTDHFSRLAANNGLVQKEKATRRINRPWRKGGDWQSLGALLCACFNGYVRRHCWSEATS